ncbi:MAG: hypothetical protein EHM26_01880, partial [Desulfobacteraceae bacterium]
KSLGYLVWRETLTAISDQQGAGVIVAEAPPGQRLVEMVQKDYHEAALRIAGHQRARMALWGVVEEDRGKILVDTFLSILTVPGAGDLSVAVGGKMAGRPSDGESLTPLRAAISRTRFNFASLSVPREELFLRPLVTTGSLVVRAKPDDQSPSVGQVAAGNVLQAVDMVDGWFAVRLNTGILGYVHAGIKSPLAVPPSRVEANSTGVNLRSGPGKDYPGALKRDLRGTFRVMDMRYRAGQGLWYRIDLGPKETWVTGSLVRPRFSIPAVHFLAGLYRYYATRYVDATAEFSQFIGSPGVQEDHLNLAAAFQLLGASRLVGAKDGRRAYEDFSQAVKLTPYDPEAYLLRSVTALGMTRPVEALRDLDTALRLDPQYPPARALAAATGRIATGRDKSSLQYLTELPRYSKEINKIMEQYTIRIDAENR